MHERTCIWRDSDINKNTCKIDGVYCISKTYFFIINVKNLAIVIITVSITVAVILSLLFLSAWLLLPSALCWNLVAVVSSLLLFSSLLWSLLRHCCVFHFVPDVFVVFAYLVVAVVSSLLPLYLVTAAIGVIFSTLSLLSLLLSFSLLFTNILIAKWSKFWNYTPAKMLIVRG